MKVEYSRQSSVTKRIGTIDTWRFFYGEFDGYKGAFIICYDALILLETESTWSIANMRNVEARNFQYIDGPVTIG